MAIAPAVTISIAVCSRPRSDNKRGAADSPEGREEVGTQPHPRGHSRSTQLLNRAVTVEGGEPTEIEEGGGCREDTRIGTNQREESQKEQE